MKRIAALDKAVGPGGKRFIRKPRLGQAAQIISRGAYVYTKRKCPSDRCPGRGGGHRGAGGGRGGRRSACDGRAGSGTRGGAEYRAGSRGGCGTGIAGRANDAAPAGANLPVSFQAHGGPGKQRKKNQDGGVLQSQVPRWRGVKDGAS